MIEVEDQKTVTGVLGIVLVFTWARERESVFIGWWGLALLLQAAGASPIEAFTERSKPGRIDRPLLDLLARARRALIAHCGAWQKARRTARQHFGRGFPTLRQLRPQRRTEGSLFRIDRSE